VPGASLSLIGNGLEGDKTVMFDANLPNTVQVPALYAR
jgi:hypothetical protein